MATYHSSSAQETELLGYQLASQLSYEDDPVILLEGDLAAGKTTFTKGIAKALGIEAIINSPSYTIMKIHQNHQQSKTLYHLDLYRLDHVGADIDLEDYMYAKGFKVIEWPNQLKDLLPEAYILIKFEYVSDTERNLTMTCHASSCKNLEMTR
jgi:tRNA threonylcarbamoyladenosine biosynthesis protein TsaE